MPVKCQWLHTCLVIRERGFESSNRHHSSGKLLLHEHLTTGTAHAIQAVNVGRLQGGRNSAVTPAIGVVTPSTDDEALSAKCHQLAYMVLVETRILGMDEFRVRFPV